MESAKFHASEPPDFVEAEPGLEDRLKSGPRNVHATLLDMRNRRARSVSEATGLAQRQSSKVSHCANHSRFFLIAVTSHLLTWSC